MNRITFEPHGYPVRFGLRPAYAPAARLGQAATQETTPPVSKPSVPVLLAAGAGGGALLGWALSVFVMPRLGSPPKGLAPYGALGGGIGGLVGVATALLMKD